MIDASEYMKHLVGRICNTIAGMTQQMRSHLKQLPRAAKQLDGKFVTTQASGPRASTMYSSTLVRRFQGEMSSYVSALRGLDHQCKGEHIPSGL